MPKFRKKPVVIEAVKVSDVLKAAAKNWRELPEWIRSEYEKGNVLFLRDSVEIITSEGRMKGSQVDWLIEEVNGEICPCNPELFPQIYEPAD